MYIALMDNTICTSFLSFVEYHSTFALMPRHNCFEMSCSFCFDNYSAGQLFSRIEKAEDFVDIPFR